MKYTLTDTGKEKIITFIKKCNDKFPNIDSILKLINSDEKVDIKGMHCICNGLTLNYNENLSCKLQYGVDYVKRGQIAITYSNGDFETPISIPNGKEPYEFMVDLALEAMRAVIIESGYEVGRTSLFWNEEENKLILDTEFNDTCTYKYYE